MLRIVGGGEGAQRHKLDRREGRLGNEVRKSLLQHCPSPLKFMESSLTHELTAKKN